jgi:hypothetical protein
MKSLLHATDIYSAVWPLHFFSKIFGLAPYSLKPHSECPINGIINCVCRIWSIIWIILFVTFEFISISNIITADYTLKLKTVETLFIASGYSCSIITLILSLTINQDKIPQVLEKLSEIDQIFSTKKYESQIYKNTRLFIIVQFMVMILTLSTLFCFGMYINRRDFSFGITITILFQILPVFSNSITILNFVNLVLLLKDKYKNLNSELDSLSFTPCNVTYLNYGNTNYMTPIENYTSTMKPSVTELRENFNSSRRRHFCNLRIIYSQLHDVALLINSTYGIPLLCATFWLFISIISGANYAIDLKLADHLYTLETVLWSIFSVVLLSMMTVSCSLAVNECNRSPVIMQKIMLRNDVDSEDLKDLDRMFTQFQVMKIEFSACGMYRIDLSFLCVIFGATFSYLVVVAQL